MKKALKILGVEFTCDESGLSLVEVKKNEIKVVANLLASQVKIHKKYGGVVPHLAAREHKKNLPYLFKKLKKEVKNLDFDFIAFSAGPGLPPALVEGKKFVQKLAKKYKKKLLPVNHLLAHIFISFLKENKIILPPTPAIALLVSGGHTEIFLIEGNFKKKFKIKMLGQTLDDAAGEAFDKVARMLGFPYPGGPEIEKIAKQAKSVNLKFPRPIIWQKNYNFSFSGLKTAVFYYLKNIKKIKKSLIASVAYEFQRSVFDVLLERTKRAIKEYNAKSFIIGGGVSANETLKEFFLKNLENVEIFWPAKNLSTDNALMIAIASLFYLKKGKKLKSPEKIDIDPNLKIDL